MVPTAPLTRRRLLATAGASIGLVGLGSALAAGESQSTPQGDDWPMARHDPAGRSYAPTATPPKDGVRVRWKHPLDTELGFHYGIAPIVVDGHVFAVGEELVVLDAASGTVQFRTDRSARTVPAVADARAYRSGTLTLVGQTSVHGLHANGGIELLGSQLGLTRWDVESNDTVSIGFSPDQLAAPPVAAANTVIASLAGRVLAIDASSGDIRWEIGVDARRPVVHGDLVYVADYGRGVFGYDLATGDQQFEASFDDTMAVGVTAGPEQLVVATDDGLAGLSYDGRVRWQFAPDDLTRDYGAVSVGEGVAYAGFRGGGDNWLVAVDVSTGAERWRSPAAPESSPQFAPPAVADGVVCLPQEDEGFAAVDADDGHVRWRFRRGDVPGPWSPAALAGDAVYIIGNGHVYALEEA